MTVGAMPQPVHGSCASLSSGEWMQEWMPANPVRGDHSALFLRTTPTTDTTTAGGAGHFGTVRPEMGGSHI